MPTLSCLFTVDSSLAMARRPESTEAKIYLAMNAKEINALSLSEITAKLRETREQLLQLRLRKQTGQVEKPHLLRSYRKDIARLETVLTSKKKISTVAA